MKISKAKQFFLRKYSPFLITSIVVLLSLLFPGYRVLTGDQKIYLPQIMHALNPFLQTNDLLFSYNQIDFTLFDEFLILLHQFFHIDLFILLFILTIITRYIYFISIYYIAYYFTKNKLFSLLSPLLFMTSMAVFGTGIGTMDYELTPRTIAFTLSLLFLACYLNKKTLIASIFLGLGMIFHVITVIPFVIFYYVDAWLLPLFRINKIHAKTIIYGCIPIVVAFFLYQSIDVNSSGVMETVDPYWHDIIAFRDPYVFMSSWGLLAFIHFISAGIFFFVIKVELSQKLQGERRSFFNVLIIIPLVLSIIFFISTEYFHVFASLQLYRSLILWKMVLSLLFFYYAFITIKLRKGHLLFRFILLWLIIALAIRELLLFVYLPLFFVIWLCMMILKRPLRQQFPRQLHIAVTYLTDQKIIALFFTLNICIFLFVSYQLHNLLLQDFITISVITVVVTLLLPLIRLDLLRNSNILFMSSIILCLIAIIVSFQHIYPEKLSDPSFIELCKWIQKNTEKEAIIMTEPFSMDASEIRIFCKRSIYATKKDGAQVVFDRNYAKEWDRRFFVIQNLGDGKDLLDLINKEGINYIISTEDVIQFENKLVFQSKAYFIYKVDKSRYTL